jgi:hypothetical protein
MSYFPDAGYKRAEGLLIRSNAGALKPNHASVADHECMIGRRSLLSRISDGISERVREANRRDLEQLLGLLTREEQATEVTRYYLTFVDCPLACSSAC